LLSTIEFEHNATENLSHRISGAKLVMPEDHEFEEIIRTNQTINHTLENTGRVIENTDTSCYKEEAKKSFYESKMYLDLIRPQSAKPLSATAPRKAPDSATLTKKATEVYVPSKQFDFEKVSINQATPEKQRGHSASKSKLHPSLSMELPEYGDPSITMFYKLKDSEKYNFFLHMMFLLSPSFKSITGTTLEYLFHHHTDQIDWSYLEFENQNDPTNFRFLIIDLNSYDHASFELLKNSEEKWCTSYKHEAPVLLDQTIKNFLTKTKTTLAYITVYHQSGSTRQIFFERIIVRPDHQSELTPMVFRNILSFYLHILLCKWVKGASSEHIYTYVVISKMILEILDDKGTHLDYFWKDFQHLKYHLLTLETTKEIVHFNLFDYFMQNSSFLPEVFREKVIEVPEDDEDFAPLNKEAQRVPQFQGIGKNVSAATSFFDRAQTPNYSINPEAADPERHNNNNKRPVTAGHISSTMREFKEMKLRSMEMLTSPASAYNSPKHGFSNTQENFLKKAKSPKSGGGAMSTILNQIYDGRYDYEQDPGSSEHYTTSLRTSYQSLMEPVLQPSTTHQIYKKRTSIATTTVVKKKAESDDFKQRVSEALGIKLPKGIIVKGRNLKKPFLF
jgi:hypothetical protein